MSSRWERSKILCSLPVAVLVTIAALDSADKALLGASFPMLEKTLGLHGKVVICSISIAIHLMYHFEC